MHTPERTQEHEAVINRDNEPYISDYSQKEGQTT